MNSNEHYLVDVIGFNEVERSMLSSIFALATRRDPGFAQFEPGSSGRSPDIYLVDSDNPAAFNEYMSLHRRSGLPAVLVGAQSRGSSEPLLPRPLQWAKLLQALDDRLGGDEDQPVTRAVPEPPTSLRHSMPGNAFGRSTPSQAGASDPVAQKRVLGDAVLVVDDNATVRAFMQAKLAPFGFEVDIAETGEEAIGLSGSQEYACVFLDVVLPGIDGYQVCKLIKSNKQAIKKTAVVMLTSRSSPFDKLRGSLAGCDEYLTKPLDEDRLLEVIAKFLPNSRKHKERRARK
ncbi:MAG: response regulator [Ramlibacter sp.]|nr:response regulator [Ramlibacter sp.]MBX3660364.1 response regulator [Ramlibacter sp.]